jgi:RNA polymerase sigma-70 factor (ECF subfamily)
MIKGQTLTDKEIIERVTQGEKSLYEMIVRRFNPHLYKVGRSYNFNHEDTRDLMQETFIDAYKSLLQFEGRADFRTWIVRIMMNNCYRRKEKAHVKNETHTEIPESSIPMFSTTQNETGNMVMNRELGHIIEEALSRIPFDYRMVFSLREINGMNVAETASLLNISEANVKVRLNRSKSMLRTHIEKSYATPELYEFNLVYCDAMVADVMRAIADL